MKGVEVTALDLATRFLDLEEVAGPASNPAVLAMLRLDNAWPAGDDVPWCSAFANYIAWLLDLPRSKSLAARSWLKVGTAVALDDAEPGFDVVVLKRGGANQPGPDVLNAQGHVAFYVGHDAARVRVLGGNQSDAVTIAAFPVGQVLGVRRIA